MMFPKKRSNFRIIHLICLFLFILIMNAKESFAIQSYKKHYLKAIEYQKDGLYEEAIEEFYRAIELKSTEKKKVRFYGMRYGEYMPHREKGFCHYKIKQYRQAIVELETSYSKNKTKRAKKYLNLAKRELAKFKQEDVIEEVQTPAELKQMKEAKAENRHGVAVIIGNRNYKNKDIPPVDYAIQDATLTKEFLITSLGYREGNIIFKTNATKGVFENIFGSRENHKGLLYDYVSPGRSDVFIYYSGHGAPSIESKKGYILPVDGNPNTVSISGYELDLLYHNLTKIKAKSITVLTDACFSGAPLFKKASPVGIIVKNPLVTIKNAAIINSSTGTQLSSWYSEKGHGLFTYYFLLGLTGRADLNRDKRISLGEIKAFIQDNVPYMARKLHGGRKQIPVFNAHNHKRILMNYK